SSRFRALAAETPERPITIAVLTSPPARVRSPRAFRGEAAAAAPAIRSARSFNFSDPARRSTIHGPKTLPEEAKAAVVIWFNAILVAVPAFNRVDPATTSGPVTRRTRISAVSSIPGDPLAVTSTVVAPRAFAR